MCNKFVILFFILSLLSSCGKNTRTFIIHNNSSWDAVIEVSDFKELGVKIKKSNYMLYKNTSAVFDFYNTGACKLISVNGAEVKTHTDVLMVLENTEPQYLKVENRTGKSIYLRNYPCLPCSLTRFYEQGAFRLFADKIISSHEDSLKIFAWQLKNCKTSDEMNALPILISAENGGQKYKTSFSKSSSGEIILLIQ